MELVGTGALERVAARMGPFPEGQGGPWQGVGWAGRATQDSQSSMSPSWFGLALGLTCDFALVMHRSTPRCSRLCSEYNISIAMPTSWGPSEEQGR